MRDGIRENPVTRDHLGILFLLVGLAPAACTPKPDQTLDPGERQMMSLLLPTRIEIVEPFTSVRRFGEAEEPRGVELLLQAVNALDNPGLMIVGRVRVELFDYVKASAEPKGRRLDYWNIELATTEQQRLYWDSITQMYRFRLALDPAAIPPAEKYLLSVTYVPPLGEILTDECVIQAREDRGATGMGREIPVVSR